MLCKGSPIFFLFCKAAFHLFGQAYFLVICQWKKSDSTVLCFCRCYVISHLPSLVMLDDHAITAEEREEARKVYGNRRVVVSSRRASKKHKEKVRLLKSLPFKNYMRFYNLGWILQSTEWQVMVRGRSRGRVQGVCKPPWDDVWLSNTTAWYSVRISEKNNFTVSRKFIYPFSLKAVSNTCIARSAAMVKEGHLHRMTRFYVSDLSTRPSLGNSKARW